MRSGPAARNCPRSQPLLQHLSYAQPPVDRCRAAALATGSLSHLQWPHPAFQFDLLLDNSRVVARLDRKRLGAKSDAKFLRSIRGVFDEQARRKPLAFAVGAGDAACYGI